MRLAIVGVGFLLGMFFVPPAIHRIAPFIANGGGLK